MLNENVDSKIIETQTRACEKKLQSKLDVVQYLCSHMGFIAMFVRLPMGYIW